MGKHSYPAGGWPASGGLMKILFDENFPSPIIQEIIGHECAHVIAIGWKGIKNGELLSKAEQAGFDVLVTFDGNIPKQNVVAGRTISVYVHKPQGQGLNATRSLVGDLLVALSLNEPGQVVTITNRPPTRK